MGDNLKPEKHGRDHCPGGEDPIPCFPTTAWVRRIFTDTVGTLTCQSGNDVVVTYNDAGVNANVWGGSADWEDYFDLFSSSQTLVRVNAFVTISCKFRWLSQDELNSRYWVILNDGGNFPEVIGYHHSGSVGQLESPHVVGLWDEQYVDNSTSLITLQQENPGNDVRTLDWGYVQWKISGLYSGVPGTNDSSDPDPHE